MTSLAVLHGAIRRRGRQSPPRVQQIMKWQLVLCLLLVSARSVQPTPSEPGAVSQLLNGLAVLVETIVSDAVGDCDAKLARRLEGIDKSLSDVVSRQKKLQVALDGVAGCQKGVDERGSSQCPGDQWMTFNGNCYLLSSGDMPWSNASDTCKAIDSRADLVSIHSTEENHFLMDIIEGKDFWIGLSDLVEEGTFVWSDGSAVDFQHWAQGEPDNSGGNQDCVWINHRQRLLWYDYNCRTSLPFICKITGAA